MKTSFKGPVFVVVCLALVYFFRAPIGAGIDRLLRSLTAAPPATPMESYANSHLPQTVGVDGEVVHPEFNLGPGSVTVFRGVKLQGETGIEVHWRDDTNFSNLKVISNVCAAPPKSRFSAGIRAYSVRAVYSNTVGCYQVAVNADTRTACERGTSLNDCD